MSDELISKYSIGDIEDELERRAKNKLFSWFPDGGELRRELYVKHMEVLAATADHNEVLFMSANRVGKTIVGAYATAVWATGRYPHWWVGKRFDGPVVCWALNKTNVNVRDINQVELLGPLGQLGKGMIPGEDIIHVKPKPSVPDGLEIAYIRHISGGQSTIFFKSYDQGREKFQGTSIHVIWPDEEIPDDIYGECLLRTMTTEGVVFCTYTPIQGLTPVTVDFLTHSVNKEMLPLKFEEKQNEIVM
jgi:phage terminase large subunit-like protein